MRTFWRRLDTESKIWLIVGPLCLLALLVLLPRLRAQTNPCGTSAHCSVLTWTASTTTGATYNVYRGTTSGGESVIALNATPITATTYTDPIALTASAQTYFYYVEAVETSGGVTALSIPSNEVSATFPAVPVAPSSVSAVAH